MDISSGAQDQNHGENQSSKSNSAQQLLMSLEEKPMMDEFVALYVGLSNKALEQKFRESLGTQPESAYRLGKSGEFSQYAIKNLQAFFKNNEAVLGKGQNAQQAAVYSKLYAGIHPTDYEESFLKLQNFIDLSLDEVKTELNKVLFPVFVCLFLNMILKSFNDEARQFFTKHKGQFLPSHKADISVLETVYDLQRLEDPEVSKYLKNKFFVKISRHSYTLLKYQVDFNQLNLILHIMNLNIQFCISSEFDIVTDSQCKESILLYDVPGSLQTETFANDLEPLNLGRLEEFYSEAWETPADEKAQKEDQQGPRKSKKIQANIIQSQIPLPDLEKDLQDLIKSEFRAQVRLSEKQLPSIGSINLLNAYQQVTCSTLSDTQDLMACGLSDSSIKVFWLNEESLKRSLCLGKYLNLNFNAIQSLANTKLAQEATQKQAMSSLSQPYTVQSFDGLRIQIAAERIASNPGEIANMLNEKPKGIFSHDGKQVLDLRPEEEEHKIVRRESEFVLVGHQGPIYSVAISLDDKFLISGSHDCTIRRWSIQTRTCLIVYNGHQFPVWDVKFAPLGYYFASCSNDRTACVWNMKQHSPVRILSGHMTDVECIEWHPNSHYVATGSCDKQIRLWEVQTGECVRLMFTVPGSVRSLKFTKNGLFLLAGNDKGQLIVFDLIKGAAIDVIYTCQQRAIWSIDVSWEDNLIAIGTEVGSIELYNMKTVLKTDKRQTTEQPAHTDQLLQRSPNPAFLRCFHTKMNGVQLVKFSWRNFLTAVGCVEKSYV